MASGRRFARMARPRLPAPQRTLSLLPARPASTVGAARSRVRSAPTHQLYRQAFSTSSRRLGPADSAAPNSPSGSGSESAGQKLKDLIKKYGRHALGVYLLLSLIDFSLSFALVHLVGAERIAPATDWIKAQYHAVRYGADEAERMRRAEVDERREEAAQEAREARQGKKAGGGIGSALFWTEFALAYSIHKIGLLPVRAGLTVAWTPKLVAWLTRRGWIGKGGIQRAAQHAQVRAKEASERIKDVAKRN